MKQPIENLDISYRFLYPRLTILVSSGTLDKPNALTIAWSTPLSADPPLVGVLITEKRYSHGIIKQKKEFVINIPNTELINGSYYIGRVSGRDEPKKLSQAGFTMEPAHKISAPRIKECLINLECKLNRIISTGDHDLFIGEVLTVVIDPKIIDDWAFDLKIYNPIYWRQSKYKEDTFVLRKVYSGEKTND
ncbi:MAG: flavin reductase family protein [Candidatus Hodarchaeota archaeon]